MYARRLFFLTFAVAAGLLVAAQETYKLEKVSKAPQEGLSEKIAGKLGTPGYRVVGPEGPLCEVWLQKELPVKPGFAPTFRVNYPFEPGQLIGAMRVPEGAKFTDFRGQDVKPGVYTLRYGQQPQDGNHIGTSQTADFLLALPAKIDQSSEKIDNTDELSQQSAKAVGTMHPAIFSLLPAEKAPEKAGLVHDQNEDYWILHLGASGKEQDKKVQVPLRMVTVGESAV